MIELEGVRARGIALRGEPTPELRGVTGKIDRGMNVLLGPRAGGGPLLLDLLAGRVRARSGAITIAGHAPGAREAHVAHVPLHAELPAGLQVNECMYIALDSHGKSAKSSDFATLATQSLAALGIEALEKRATDTLTSGEHRAVVLAAALACEPRVLLVEEPQASFDPRAQANVTKLLLAYAEKDATLICATQSPHDAARLGGRTLRVERGFLAEAPPRRETRGFSLTCERAKDLAAALATLASVESLRTAGPRVVVTGDPRALARDIGALVAKSDFDLQSFEPCDPETGAFG